MRFASRKECLCHFATLPEMNASRREKTIALRLRVIHTPAPTPSAKVTNWRRAKRARESRFFSARRPPPPAKTIGGGGRISREKCTFWPFQSAIWRRGSVLIAFHAAAQGSAVFPPCLAPRAKRSYYVPEVRLGSRSIGRL